ncbi:MAG: TerB family tellurite resistance protein [Pseudomonadota bacterium]
MVWTRIRRALGLGNISSPDNMLERELGTLAADDCRATNGTAFTAAVVALSAKMAKADGVASGIEYDAFARVFKPGPKDADRVQRLFDLAKRDIAGFESYAKQIARLLAGQDRMKRDVFEGLFHIAAADGVLHAGEERYLKRVAELFDFDETTYEAIRALFVHDPDDAYTILGVDRAISDADLKSHYRALLRETHPDRLIAREAAPEVIEKAQERAAALNAAYEDISRERGL